MSITLPHIKGTIRENADLSKTNWFQVGGPAKYLYKPTDINDLSYFLENKPKDLKIFPLGVGSNIIIRDGGIDGTVIKLGRNFTNIDIDNTTVMVGAGALDYNISNYLAKESLSGLEFYVGIPGTIGGAICMNAGCYSSETADFLVEAEAVRIKDGKIFKLSNKDFGFKYRSNSLNEEFVFVNGKYKLHSENSDKILKKMQEISQMRESTQPIRARTGGSTFKNPPEHKAWELIDKCGLRGYKIGGAQISEKHCNFMINNGDATASDLEKLGDFIIKTIFEKTNIKLEWEIKRIGKYK